MNLTFRMDAPIGTFFSYEDAQDVIGSSATYETKDGPVCLPVVGSRLSDDSKSIDVYVDVPADMRLVIPGLTTTG